MFYRDSRDYIRVILGLYRDNGKEAGKYREYRGHIGFLGVILGLYRDNGKENGNYFSIMPGSGRAVSLVERLRQDCGIYLGGSG